MLSVCDGQTCIGHIINRGRSGFEAFDADERSLGVFATMKLAFAAASGAFSGGAR
jgi:hypothetical protein